MTTTTTPEAAFAQALAEFQGNTPKIGKGQTANTGTYSYTYADLADILAVAAPVLAQHGLSWTAAPTMSEHGFVLRYALLHAAGHRESGEYPLPDPAKFSPQQIGSAITYARRYAFTALTGIAPGGEDDGGQRAQDARAAHRPNRADLDAKRKAAARVRELGAALGLDMDGLRADYHARFDGDLLTADVDDLAAYAAVLESEGVPA